MKIQKMFYETDNEIIESNCGVNLFVKAGKFTFCGHAIPDSNLKYDGF